MGSSYSNQSMVVRGGHSTGDYLVEFCNFLRRRTGFRADHFTASSELQKTLEILERQMVPMNMWQAFLNGAVRALSLINAKLTRGNFISYFISMIGSVVSYFFDYWLLRAFVFILKWIMPSYLTWLITGISYLVEYAFMKFSCLFQLRLKAAANFAIEQINCRTGSSSLSIEN